MSNLSPTNLETVDYGIQGWSAIITTNMQRLNTFLGRIYALVDGTTPADGQIARFNSTTGKWECQDFSVNPEDIAGLAPSDIAGLTALAPAVQNGFVGAGAMSPPETGGAVPESLEFGASALAYPVLSFGNAEDTVADFSLVMPENWDRGTVKAKLLWVPEAGAAGGEFVKFTLAAGSVSHGDTLAATMGTAVELDDIVDAAGQLHATDASAAITVGGSPALGDLLHFRVTRDFDYAGTGTALALNAHLVGAWIQYGVSNAVTPW